MTVSVNLTSPNLAGLVTGVGACIVDALGQTPAGAPTRQCLLLPTASIPWDNCDCGGQVALAVTQVYGSQVFPGPAAATDWHKCGPRLWVAKVVVSVVRCVATIDQNGQPPPCPAALADALVLEQDRTAVRQAIACCLAQMRASHPPQFGLAAWQLDASVTVGEQGGCAGSETTFWVGVAACHCPTG